MMMDVSSPPEYASSTRLYFLLAMIHVPPVIAGASARLQEFAVTSWYYSAMLIKMQGGLRKNLHFSAKYGIEIEDGTENVFTALAVAPYIYNSSNMVNMLANSGILNCFLA